MSICQIFNYFISFNKLIKLTEYLFLLFVEMLDLVQFLGDVIIEDLLGVLLGGALTFALHYEFGVSDLGKVSEGFLLSTSKEATVVGCSVDFAAARKNSYLKRILPFLGSVTDIVLDPKAIVVAVFFVELIDHHHLSAIHLKSMRCDAKYY